jgi:hypothetical protein
VYARRVQRIVGQGSAINGIGCDAGQLRPQTRGEGSKRRSFPAARRFLLPHLARHDPVDGEDAEIVSDTPIRRDQAGKTKHPYSLAIQHKAQFAMDLTGSGGPTAATRDRVHMDKGDVDS